LESPPEKGVCLPTGQCCIIHTKREKEQVSLAEPGKREDLVPSGRGKGIRLTGGGGKEKERRRCSEMSGKRISSPLWKGEEG